MLRTCSAYEMSSAVEVPMPMPRNQSEDNLLTIATEPQAPVPKPRTRNQALLDSLTSPTGETPAAAAASCKLQNDAMPNNAVIQVSADVDQGANEKPPALPAVRPAALVQNTSEEQPPVPKPRKDLMKSSVEPSRHVPAPRPTDISNLGSPGMEAPPPPSAYLGDPGSPPPPPPTEEMVNQFYQQNGMNGLMQEAPGPAVPPRPKAGPAAPPTVPSRSAPPPPVPPRRDLMNK